MRIAGLSISEIPRLLLGGGGAQPRDPARAINPGAARQFCRSWSGGGFVLLCLCLAVYLPGLVSIPPVDRDESRFAQASRQMYESGDYIVPRIQDRPRLNKPPLIYWLQCASIAVFGDREGQYPNANIWVFRVPSVLAAIASVLLTWRFGLRLFDPRAALLGAALLAVAPMIVWDAHQARADQVLLTTVIATQWALYEVWRASTRSFAPEGHRNVATGEASAASETRGIERIETRRPGRGGGAPILAPLAFWVSLSLGILTKGPIAPLIALLTILALSITTRSWRWLLSLRPVLGALILTALIAPWVYAVATRPEIGWSKYLHTIYDETIARSAAPKEGHWGPPGYHTVLLCILFWPGVLTTAAAVKRAWQRTFSVSTVPPTSRSRLVAAKSPGRVSPLWRRLRSARPSPSLFLLAWILPAWLLFELIATKLPHYTMPMYPAIALLSGRVAMSNFIRPATRPGLMIWSCLGAVFVGVPILSSLVLAFDLHNPFALSDTAWLTIALVALVLVGLAIGRVLGRHLLRPVAILVCACGSIVLASALLLTVVLPPFGNLSIQLTDAARAADPSSTRPIATVGYTEDSLLFATRGRATRIGVDNLAAWRLANPRGMIVMPVPMAATHSDARGLEPLAGSQITGANFSAGWLSPVGIYEPAP